jgi:hypothetical protein
VFGGWCALGGAQRIKGLVESTVVRWLAVVYLVVAFGIVMTWYFPWLGTFVPRWVGEAIYPISKPNLDVLRILHFLSLAVVTLWVVPRGWPALNRPIFRPAIVCGQHSLETFCLGVFLSFAGHFVFTEVSNSLAMHVIVSVVGVAVMAAAALLASWYKRLERRGPPRPPTPAAASAASGGGA